MKQKTAGKMKKRRQRKKTRAHHGFDTLRAKFLAWKEKLSPKLLRMQMLCMLASALLAGLAYFMAQESSPIQQGNQLARNKEGGAATSYDLMVEGLLDGEALPISVNVSPKRYTRVEAETLFRDLVLHMEERILGENPNLSAVSENLELPSSIPELGVKLSWDYTPVLPEMDMDAEAEKQWMKKYRRLIEEDGTVNNELFSADEEVAGYLSVVLAAHIEPEGNSEYESNRYQSEPFQIFVYVTAKQLTEEAQLKKLLMKELEQADRQSYGSSTMRLPVEVNGKKLHYSGRSDHSYLMFLFLGLTAAVALYMREEAERRTERQKREAQLLLDYPELVSKLMVYVGAGLTVRSAFERISLQYDRMVEDKTRPEHFLYQELRSSRMQMERGVPEGSVYADFGKRINLKPYTKLCSLIEQNRKNGTKNMRALLQLEMADAFEQRKNTARRLGEEAGTKLLLPLFMLLGIVMVIVLVPAMMTLQ